MDLQVPVRCCPASAARGLAQTVEAVGQVRDLLLQGLSDGCKVPLVAGNQRRVGLGDKMIGKVERIGGHGGHVIISTIEI